VFLSAGPRAIKVPTESVLLPKINTGSTTTNVAEAATISASDIALETVALTPEPGSERASKLGMWLQAWRDAGYDV
jgi:hypothetical protein